MAFDLFSFYAFLLFPGRLRILIQHPSLLKHQWLISPSALQKDTPFFRDAVTSHSQIRECEQNVSGIHRPCHPICLIPLLVSCLQVPHNHSAFWATSGTLSPARYCSPEDPSLCLSLALSPGLHMIHHNQAHGMGTHTMGESCLSLTSHCSSWIEESEPPCQYYCKIQGLSFLMQYILGLLIAISA